MRAQFPALQLVPALLLIAALAATHYPVAARGASSLQRLQGMSDGFAEVASRATPSVVSIATEQVVTVAGRNPFRGTPFQHYFGIPEQGEQEFRKPGAGSGVIVEYGGDQYIVTNNHVVSGAEQITVQLADDRELEAEVVGTDSLSDVAVLRVDNGRLPAIAWGTSADLRVGEWVLAIGNPFELSHTVTTGIISALGRERNPRTREYGSYIQTDAAINPGNSGGALVNLEGELVGINTAIVTRSGGYDGISYAIPIDLVRDVLVQLVEHGEVRRGLLGVEIGDLDPIAAEALGMDDTHGVLISKVREGGPAAAAGVEDGDVILAIDGEPMRNTLQLRSLIGRTAPGTEVELRILRKKKERTIEVELGQLTEESFAEASRERSGEGQEGQLGMRLQDVTPELARRLRYSGDGGVLVVDVQRGSAAARAGLSRGDIILEVNQEPVADLNDYETIIGELESGDAVLLRVQRRGVRMFVSLRMP